MSIDHEDGKCRECEEMYFGSDAKIEYAMHPDPRVPPYFFEWGDCLCDDHYEEAAETRIQEINEEREALKAEKKALKKALKNL